MPAGAPVPGQVYWLGTEQSMPAQGHRVVQVEELGVPAGGREELVFLSLLPLEHQNRTGLTGLGCFKTHMWLIGTFVFSFVV